MDMSEIRTIECKICHLDTPRENSQDGVCYNCLDSIEREERFCTRFERFGMDVEWDDYNAEAYTTYA